MYMDYNLTTSVLVIYCNIFHPWTKQRFSWECVIGGWLASLAKWLHRIMVFKLLMKWRGNDNYINMSHQSYFMFLDHVDHRHV